MTKSRFVLQWIAAAASLIVLPLAANAQQKTAKACEAEWRANKASIQGSGKTKKAFVTECRSGTGRAAAAPPATAQGSATAQPPAASAPAPERRRTAREMRRGSPVSTNGTEFATEAEAKAHCPGRTVVWANRRSKIYHFAGARSYGNTKNGAYMCENDTATGGFRSAKNEKPPR